MYMTEKCRYIYLKTKLCNKKYEQNNTPKNYLNKVHINKTINFISFRNIML